MNEARTLCGVTEFLNPIEKEISRSGAGAN